uniref:Potassium/proton antiporter CemA n=1 Tax=Pleurastrosarcina brevispinosa TaxID=163096 RepID=A0A097KMZ8_9CHLO|nr:chloroplast enveloppe membrane protein [Chlorosarcina brevispinosa]
MKKFWQDFFSLEKKKEKQKKKKLEFPSSQKTKLETSSITESKEILTAARLRFKRKLINQKQTAAKQSFARSLLVPRSIIRTFERFGRQLLPGAEKLVLQEFRISRYQLLVSVKCLISLILIPLIVNCLAKTFILTPLTEYLWNTQQHEIFLNLYQENRALKEMINFEEKIYFESFFQEFSPIFMTNNSKPVIELVSPSEEIFTQTSQFIWQEQQNNYKEENNFSSIKNFNKSFADTFETENKTKIVYPIENLPFYGNLGETNYLPLDKTLHMQQKFQQKTLELAENYNHQSIEAITNLFADFITFGTVTFLFIWMKPQIIILRSFLTESIYSLSDTLKSFLLILLTDLLVGFHSPRGWEIFIEFVLRHFGLPENQEFILLFVATFPVLLDTVFKYWIFRYLNQISPSTVATYHSMIE